MAQVDIGIKLGHRSATACRVFVGSLSSSDITCNGATQTPVAVGSDRGSAAPGGQTTAMYATAFDVAAVGETPFTVTQDGNSDGGIIPDHDFDCVVHSNCDDLTNMSNPTNAHSYLRHLRSKGRNPLHVKSDDPIYADRNTIDDTGFTGHKATGEPQSTNKEYDYALVYAAQLGLLGNPTVVSTDPYSGAIRVGHDVDRQWCDRHVPCYMMGGDHVFADNAGYDNEAQAGAWWEASSTVWTQTYGAILPPRLNGLDHDDFTGGMHWSVDLGNLNITCLDRVTQGQGGGASGTELFGDTQIDECLAAIDGTGWAKLVIIPNCIRYLKTDEGDGVVRGANEPIADERAAEYARLMTAEATGIQARAAASGFKFAVITPDHHNQQVLRHENSGGAVTESFVSLTSGTGFGSQNHAVDASLVPGLTYNGTTIVYNRPTVNTDYRSAWLHAELVSAADSTSGSEELHLFSINENFEVVWSGALIDGQTGGNLPSSIVSKHGAGR